MNLIRALGLRDSLGIIAGSMIGTGIFLKTATMTQQLGSPFWVLVAWLAAGVLSLMGALTFAELGSLFPEAGGGYVYVREAFGRMPAFLYGWISFWIIAPGSVAAYGAGAATFLSSVAEMSTFGGPKVVAIVFILVFSLLNCLAVSFGGKFQSALTALKVLLIFGMSFGIFILAEPPAAGLSAVLAPASSGVTLSAFGAAMIAALWAYDGWDGLPRMSAEVKNAQRIVPLALGFGAGAVFLIYLIVNIAYFWALPVEQMSQASSRAFPNAPSIAAMATQAFWSDGARWVSLMFVVSALGAMNGSIMTSARVPFAMARDGLFFRQLGRVSPNTRVPVISVLSQAAIAMVLAISGTFDQLTDYVVFAAWIFYGLIALAVFKLREKLAHLPRAYHVPGYPWVPLIFIVCTAFLLVNTVWYSPRESLIGLGFIVAGVPAYYIFNRKK